MAIDLGGTQIKYGLVSQDGCSLLAGSEPTGSLIVDLVVARLARRIQILQGAARERGLECAGAGLGVPGGIYEDRATISQSPNFPGWNDVDLKTPLKRAVDLPIYLENDGNVAVLGEHWLGAGRGRSHLLLYTLGTGVGSGLMLNAKLWRGAFGMAAEAGHICVDPHGPACGCGSHGCVETFASATAIINRGRAAVAAGRGQGILEQADGDETKIDAACVARAARAGDAAALEIFRVAGEALGRGCAAVVNLLNVELILFGGGVSASYDLLEPHVVREMKLRSFRVPAERVELGRAVLGNEAGMFGAALLALRDGEV